MKDDLCTFFKISPRLADFNREQQRLMTVAQLSSEISNVRELISETGSVRIGKFL